MPLESVVLTEFDTLFVRGVDSEIIENEGRYDGVVVVDADRAMDCPLTVMLADRDNEREIERMLESDIDVLVLGELEFEPLDS